MHRVPFTDLAKEVFNWFLLLTIKPVGAVFRLFYPPPPPRDDSVLPARPMRRVFFNAQQLAYVLGDREIQLVHLAAAIELDGRMMQERYWRTMMLSPEADAAWKTAIAAAGGISKATPQDLRNALAKRN